MIKQAAKFLLRWDRLSAEDKYVRRYRLAALAANIVALFPLPLPWLFRVFGSDKQQPGGHRYGPTYWMLFRPWKYRPVKLLEIGVGGYGGSLGGESLLAWQAYFPFGRIFGADIEDKTKLAGWRRTVLCLDQSSDVQLTELARRHGLFDLIVDDGSHLSAHQIFTFERLFDALADGGIYVIEDVQTSFWSGAVGGLTWDGAPINDPRFQNTCYAWFLELSKYLNQAEFLDRTGLDEALSARAETVRRISFEHNLIVVWKGDNRDRSNRVNWR